MSAWYHHPLRIAGLLYTLALLRSLLIALILPPSYGADGGGYLAYMEAFKDFNGFPEADWIIRGTTPVYPLFAYTASLFGSLDGYSIAFVQVLLGGLIAPSLFLALYRIHFPGALISATLIAIDPQTGILLQHVATEALYITGLGLGFAAFWWLGQRPHTPLWMVLGLGFFLGLGALVRPVGAFLIVPYVVFWFILTRSAWGSAALGLGYALLVGLLILLNLWRFDFAATHNNSGLYLGTRLFGVGELYARTHGPASQDLYQKARACDLDLSQSRSDDSLNIAQDLRLCLYFTHELSLNDISRLYSDVYSEATRAQPDTFTTTVLQQFARYIIRTSDPYDDTTARAYVVGCDTVDESLYQDWWFTPTHFFCPQPASPLRSLGNAFFLASLGFSIFTQVFYFGTLGLLWGKNPRGMWAILMGLGLFSYHALVTAVAGTILSRYITVTNSYTLLAAGFFLGELWQHRKTYARF